MFSSVSRLHSSVELEQKPLILKLSASIMVLKLLHISTFFICICFITTCRKGAKLCSFIKDVTSWRSERGAEAPSNGVSVADGGSTA